MPVIGVSVAIPEPWGEELQAARIGVGDEAGRSIPTHITLLPPTEVDEADLPAIDAHLAEVARGFDAFEVELRGTGTFRPTSPVVFVMVRRGVPHCERLEAAVRTGPLARELSFPYHPHVTVAHNIDDAGLDRAYDELADYHASFAVTEFLRYVQGEDGVWRPVRNYRLARRR